jgi:hypothetical protein
MFFIYELDHFSTKPYNVLAKFWGRVRQAAGRVPNVLTKRCMAFVDRVEIEWRSEKNNFCGLAVKETTTT